MPTAAEVGDFAERHELTVAVAESLTGGNLAAALCAAADSAQWFRGGIVAYAASVKRSVLGVPDVPVVSETAALAMARGVRELMDADVAVATTGVGGPGDQDGEPAGSVWCSVATRETAWAVHRTFDGDPAQVLDQSVACALELLHSGAQRVVSASPDRG
ncbi:CinA family protein [Nocardia mangyaensis]|uniref:CinA family protein n=1 Tax=Nocardia mangyaensis TaxID=2213200 RepID=UPI00267731D3|nr:CinA family protein [Nocardia mangyaensis]MDO3649899.1 CinA family protein [Nocardia mangyaensis]